MVFTSSVSLSPTLEILYQDNKIIAVNKPNGLMVHRTKMAIDADAFAVQLLRNQIGKHVYPLHRLDRKTSGVLLFCQDKASLDNYFSLFRKGEIHKNYIAIVRGYTEDQLNIDYPLKKENGKLQEAYTSLRTLGRYEIAVPLGKFDSSRYSIVELIPQTGRMHQLRKHMAHIFHPIIGDRPYGCNKQNRMWKSKWKMQNMLLHARRLRFKHPHKGQFLEIEAGFPECFNQAKEILCDGENWPII